MQRNTATTATIKKSLQKKITEKVNTAYNLTWEVVEILCKELQTPLSKLIDVSKFKDSKELIAALRENLNDDPMQVLSCIKDQLSAYSKLGNKLPPAYFDRLQQAHIKLSARLKENKKKEELLKLEENLYICLNELVKTQYKIIHDYCGEQQQASERLIPHIEASLSLINFFEKECLIVDKTQHFTTPNLMQFDVDLVKILVGIMQRKNQDGWQVYLDGYPKRATKIIVSNPLAHAEYMQWYYLTKFCLAGNQNNLSQAKTYFLKANAEALRMLDLGSPVSVSMLRSSFDMIASSEKNNHYRQALFYISQLKSLLIASLALPKLSKENKAIFEQGLQYCAKELKPNYKAKLIDQAIKKLQEFNSSSMRFGWYRQPQAKNAQIGVKIEDEKLNAYFYELCEQENLLFVQDGPNIVFNKGHKLDLNKLITVIKKFQAHETPSLPNKITTEQTAATNVVASSQSVVTEPVPQLNISDEFKQEKTEEVKTENPTVKQEKTVMWNYQYEYKKSSNDSNVFKLYSPYSKRDYVTIDPLLAKEIYATNKYAYYDLESMCDVGKVLGNSKGRKGFIVKSTSFFDKDKSVKNKKTSKKNVQEEQKPQYIKGKNCRKNWRFYGHLVETVTIEGKQHRLFVIDSWKPKHNSKLITVDKRKTLS